MTPVRLLLDTNVILDVVLDRAAFRADALALFAEAESGAYRGLVGATSITTVHHVARKALGDARAHDVVRHLGDLFEIAPVGAAVIGDALAQPHGDFEDAVLAYAAVHSAAVGVVTRDPAGFAGGLLPVYAPDEALAVIRAR